MEWQSPAEYIEFENKFMNLIILKMRPLSFFAPMNTDSRLRLEEQNEFLKELILAGDLVSGSHAKIPLTGDDWVGYDDWEIPFGVS